MSEWEKVEEDGQESWWHPKLGGIVKTGDTYVVQMPLASIAKFGPFGTLRQAQDSIDSKRVSNAIEAALDSLNLELIKEQ